MSILAGLLCAPRSIKGLGTMEGIKGKSGKVLTAKDFDTFNNEPEAPKELSMEHMFTVLSGGKG